MFNSTILIRKLLGLVSLSMRLGLSKAHIIAALEAVVNDLKSS